MARWLIRRMLCAAVVFTLPAVLVVSQGEALFGTDSCAAHDELAVAGDTIVKQMESASEVIGTGKAPNPNPNPTVELGRLVNQSIPPTVDC